MFFSNFFITDGIKEILLRIVRSMNGKPTKYVGHFFGRAKFKNTSFKTEYLGLPRYVKFSWAQLPVPQMVEKYLSLRYGPRFMDLPDEKTKSLYPSHSAFVDLNKDYKFYEKS